MRSICATEMRASLDSASRGARDEPRLGRLVAGRHGWDRRCRPEHHHGRVVDAGLQRARAHRACGDAVCGRIVWLWDDTPKGIVDKAPLIGRTVIDRMVEAEGNQWRGGRLYNPEDGRDYKGSLQLRSPTRLVVDGCVLFVCQTQVWRRADVERCPPVAP
jgi:hypothetical protein